ncbi:MAG: aminotransferase class III-fold pyridoxal phosphate-dependent enzyme [Chloroflexi bacterium]|nr:aminotransferase class III-fold pyridoxal phosphate-dependent enzyme [Chloroflexota bacterium]
MSNAIIERYTKENANSRALHEKAATLLPGGIAHDVRHQDPFPFYILRASGARKWDADGHELIDLGMGHGALILGHNYAAISRAVAEQMRVGTHFSASHPAEIQWAERIVKMVPSAEMVRFVASGTEATMMAMRLSRAFTGRPYILRFEGHFHGWNDYASVGLQSLASNKLPGIPETVRESMRTVPHDLGIVENELKTGKIAGIILEPTGASYSKVPMPDGFLKALRALSTKYDTVLIFDEVIGGFRWSPGGVQGRVGVTPDLTTMAKIVAGGLPGGAVAGRRDIMDQLTFKGREWNIEHKVLHNGTFNANPVSAAAAIVCLDAIADGKVHAFIDAQAAKLRKGMNQILNRMEIEGAAYGDASVFHVILGVPVAARGEADLRDPGLSLETLKKGSAAEIDKAFHLAMYHHGVHVFHSAGLLSMAHDDDVLAATLGAFERSLGELQDAKLL